MASQNVSSKPAFVQGYRYDVFVSYADVDNTPLPGSDELSGWVYTFVDNLKVLLSQQFGRKEWGNVWMDRQLRGDISSPAKTQQAVCQSATLLVILSEGYLNSDSCREERELFLSETAKRIEAEGRVFVVKQMDIDHSRWPEAFKDLRGYEFYRKDRDDMPASTLGKPVVDPKNSEGRLYFQRLNDLSRELAGRLQQMEKMPSPALQSPEVAKDNKAVFLAEVTADLTNLRDSVKRQLEQKKLRVLPETFYERTPAAFQAAMRKDLAQSVLFVQLLGPYTSQKTPDLPGGYEGLQLDVAKDANKPIFRWCSPDLDVADVDDHNLFSRDEVMAMAFEDFKLLVEKQTHSLLSRENVVINGDAFILVNAKRSDMSVAEDIAQMLESHHMGYDIICGRVS